MKKTILVVGLIILVFLLYVLNIFVSTGYFREITPFMAGEVIKKIEIPGAEDITISYEGQFALISSDDRASRRDGEPHQGGLFYLDLKSDNLEPKLISGQFEKPFNPHGISLYQVDSALYKVLVINHVRGVHSVEHFILSGDSLVHQETLQDASMISPNDVVAIDENRFYFTNDHGYTSRLGVFFENYLGLSVSNVVLFDGSDYREVAPGIAYANGINYDPKRSLVYVASPRGFAIKVYEVGPEYDLTHLTDIDVNTGADNIEIDQNGFLWIGAHPDLLGFKAYSSGKKSIAPSEVLKVDFRGESDYSIEQIMVDNGNIISATSVAAVYKDIVLIGNVMDDHFLIIRLSSEK